MVFVGGSSLYLLVPLWLARKDDARQGKSPRVGIQVLHRERISRRPDCVQAKIKVCTRVKVKRRVH